ncbi:MAG: TetR/AcrR family transcriptional regulator [Ardenticatenaceae bacterium]|nr:TetR/AcrR family transcriptional regulator [Ardenticatenaceae bacterium]
MSERKKSRQEEVYAAAAKLFATKGYHATRVQDIADELGILKGSLYYYFSSKEDLLVKITEGKIEELLAAIEAIAETGYPPRQKLALAIDEHLRFFQQHVHIYTIFVKEQLADINKRTANNARKMNRAYQQVWKRMVEEGIKSGEFRPDLDTELIMRAILGLCNYTWTWYDPAGRVQIRELARIFTEMILSGIDYPPNSPNLSWSNSHELRVNR